MRRTETRIPVIYFLTLFPGSNLVRLLLIEDQGMTSLQKLQSVPLKAIGVIRLSAAILIDSRGNYVYGLSMLTNYGFPSPL